MAKSCEKCFCYVYDTVVRPLPPSDPFYKIFKFKSLIPIAPEVTREILRTVDAMGDNLYLSASTSKDLLYPTLLCVEAGFARCDRKVSKYDFMFQNPITYTHLYLQRICTSLRIEIAEIHRQHSGLAVVIEQKDDMDDLYA